ncbi:FTR1 family protein [Bacillaceae bacterium]
MDFQAFLITFREGLEALLIVGIITTYLAKMEKSEYNKWVWVGVAGAVFSSFVVAFLFQVIFTGFTAMGYRHYMRIGIMLISSILLTQMVLWMKESSEELNAATREKLKEIVTAGSVFGMVVHAYLVVLREGVETVFFFAAISQGDISKAIQSQGALLGIVFAAAVAWIIFKTSLRFPLKKFFQVTGFLIMMIAAGLLVQAIGAMQDYGMIGSLKPQLYNIVEFMPEHPVDEEHLRREGKEPLISGQVGIFFMAMFGYSHSPSFEEVAAYVGYFAAIFAYLRYKSRRQERERAEGRARKRDERLKVEARV